MPGPGPHMFCAMATGLMLDSLSDGRFGPHHVLLYTIHSFTGPDLGVFMEWILKDNLKYYPLWVKILLNDGVHHPYGFMLVSLLLAWFSSLISKELYQWRILHSKAPLTWIQCFLLGTAGGLSHFFLDNLFEDKPKELQWVLSTGNWNHKEIYPTSVLVLGFMFLVLFSGFFCLHSFQPATPERSPFARVVGNLQSAFGSFLILFGGFFYLHSFQPGTPERSPFAQVVGHLQSAFGYFVNGLQASCNKALLMLMPFKMFRALMLIPFKMVRALILMPFKIARACYEKAVLIPKPFRMPILLFVVACFYEGWLIGYKASNKVPGIGEEADIGVLYFMVRFFVLPHLLCLMSMHP